MQVTSNQPSPTTGPYIRSGFAHLTDSVLMVDCFQREVKWSVLLIVAGNSFKFESRCDTCSVQYECEVQRLQRNFEVVGGRSLRSCSAR